MNIKPHSRKHLLYSILFLFLALLAWFCRSYYFDEEPVKGRETFYAYHNQPIADATNVVVGIAGLDAPIENDPLQYGRTAMNNFSKNINYTAPDHALKFVGADQADIVNCELADAVEIEFERCINVQDVGKLIAKNAVILQRYTDLYTMQNWQGEAPNNGQNLINLNRLIGAKIKWLILNKN